ncbi:DUF421 domain-containing protein [uncultured Corynebacterium sp.]|uniref:DUF421 domain-containing protein n=1 Tax=uncultured Corynebacterium sp. TaxID=159447 RepID=UPI0025F39710|nr:YetF domain-containing protein [uncultured Corynebacterium sp.]
MEWLDVLSREAVYQLGIEPHRIAIVVTATVGIYLAFMVLVKIFGSRVLTSMTASDAVIIIMFGAVSGRVIVGNPPTLASGVVGLTTLMVLEAAFGTIRRYVGWSRYIDRRPILLMFAGVVHEDNMRFAHVSESDIASAIRKAGLGRRADVQVMILEPTGQISIIKAGQPLDPGILQGVLGVDDFEALRPQQGAGD